MSNDATTSPPMFSNKFRLESERTDGGPAFPQYAREGEVAQAVGGLSLRDWFAGQALSGLLVGRTVPTMDSMQDEAAIVAYQLADAMLAERVK